MKHYNRKDVIDLNDFIHVDERQISYVIRVNAEILRDILDRLDIIETGIKAQRKRGSEEE